MQIHANKAQLAANTSDANRAAERKAKLGDFRQVLAQAKEGIGPIVTVQRGDTLMGLTRNYLGNAAGQFNNGQILEIAKTIARENGIANPNRILPGQALNMSPMSTMEALKLRLGTIEAIQLAANAHVETSVLDKTLARAVAKGFLPADQQAEVRNKILSLATEHRFAPDDFARMTLMESDGMNPKASNGFCHGIIQFCANTGATGVGYASNPKEILNLSVMDQLNLVDRYFTRTRLKEYGPASLDNLYLTVLTPGARSEPRTNVPLKIPGRQAAYLYEGRDPNAGIITRNSILSGLRLNAQQRLGEFTQTIAKIDSADL
ncbi:MAG: LysM peptidoglycan-binding domain-containing protein [Betaproteobacteria bacterium]|nr:LysM peptidoglycan-binding domain-containing protein [Betaproteobacteria bacterium]